MRVSARLFSVLGWVVITATAACHGSPPPGPLDPRPVRVIDSWTVQGERGVLGRVVLLQIDDPAGAVRLYRAENDSGQWLGWVDAQGRVWQRVPFEDDDQFRGVYPMEKGLALLYEVPSPVRLLHEAGVTEASDSRRKDNDR